MAKVQVEVPSVGESVKEGVLTAWLVKEGESVHEGADLFELETDKASMAVPSPGTGVLHVVVPEGSEVKIGQLVAEIDTAGSPGAPATASAGAPPAAGVAAAIPADAASKVVPSPEAAALSPAVRRLVEENQLDPAAIRGSGKGGRITKEDVLVALEARPKAGPPSAPAPSAPAPAPTPTPASAPVRQAPREGLERQRRERMSSLRKAVARRLVEAKTATAHLTTFNEVNMERIMSLRSTWQESFQARHGIKLGFMSFFISASCHALAEFPMVNAMIDGEDVVYNNVYDVGVAVSTDRGLVVPVIRDANRKSLAELEGALAELAERARTRKILPDELQGGTFTITNGGVFGSLLSTPIINYPQSAILGLHAIQKRPVVVEDQIVAKPMMYLALSYDHRLIDGREAVTFLARIKGLCESPERMLLGV